MIRNLQREPSRIYEMFRKVKNPIFLSPTFLRRIFFATGAEETRSSPSIYPFFNFSLKSFSASF
ncbi:hypothetical protein LEP1GSC137_2014 [Leptospira borgpetersenii str. Noumea 25]|nr:hypothetical protein LEP1GSC137_2014 [Leptospira borgpetersenii str. Noumea 25]